MEQNAKRSQGSEVGRSAILRSVSRALAALAATIIVLSSGTASAALTVRANHDHITIDFFYHGSTVGVKGVTDAGRDLVITFTSPEGHQTMKRKGKVGGVLWMNTGTLTFERTPNLYEVFSTRELGDILSPVERKKHVLGYNALQDHIAIPELKSDEEKAAWFGEFVKFKEASMLYMARTGTIGRKPLGDGHEEYSLHTSWPYQAAPGEYTVTVYAVRNGNVVERAETKVRVEQVGLVKTLASMANGQGALYGLLSVVIAIGAGFGVGMIFRKGGGSH